MPLFWLRSLAACRYVWVLAEALTSGAQLDIFTVVEKVVPTVRIIIYLRLKISGIFSKRRVLMGWTETRRKIGIIPTV